MNNLPKIKIEKNLKREVDIFSVFLNNTNYPQNRNFILHAFPDLELQLKTSEDEKDTIRKFIVDFRKKNWKITEQIIKESEILIKKKGDQAMRALASLMDYNWSRTTVYKAIPTILPFSPLGNNMFYFSILGQIKDATNNVPFLQTKNQNTKDILYTAIHEISHFIFYDILKKIEQETKSPPIDDNLRNYLKESLAVVILNSKPLCTVLNLHEYFGNPEIRDLQIVTQDGDVRKFVDFLQKTYQHSRTKKEETFQDFLQGILDTLLPASKEFLDKRKIWNQFGRELFKDPKALKAYRRPISLK